MKMDTLKAAHQLEAAGLEKRQAEAITRVINDLGRANLITKAYLDMRLSQRTVAIVVVCVAIAGLFKLFD